MNLRDDILIVCKGFGGLFASASGIYVSFLPELEIWLRVLGLLAGLAVAAATFVSIVLSIRWKLRRDRWELERHLKGRHP